MIFRSRALTRSCSAGGSAAMKLTDMIRSTITRSGSPVSGLGNRCSRRGPNPSAGNWARHFWLW